MSAATASAGYADALTGQVYTNPETGQTITEKECSRCGLSKPLDFFYRKAKGKYGRQEWCKRCMRNQPPLSAQDEMMAQQEKTPDTTEEIPENLEPATDAAAAAVLDELATPTETAYISGVEATNITDVEGNTVGTSATATPFAPTTESSVSFRDWMKSSAGSTIFGTPDFAVVRIQGTSSFTIHLAAESSQRMRKMADYVPAGAIPSNILELIVRVLTNTLDSDEDIRGYAYY